MKIAKFEFSLFGVNTYVVWNSATKKGAVIDPGMINREEEDALYDFVKRESLTVTHIIYTHLHIDHAIGGKFARDTFKAQVYAHKDDEFLGSCMMQQAQMFVLNTKTDNVMINTFLKDGDKISIGNGMLQVIHVPGHSPGGIALYDPDGGYVITGDSLFAGSIGRTDLPGGDIHTLLESVRGKLLTLPPDTLVFPGHGPETTIARELASNPFLKNWS